jgi:micrococcal nuclease
VFMFNHKALFVLLLFNSFAFADFKGVVVDVVDGDTIKVKSESLISTVRLADIDAPECSHEKDRSCKRGQAYGKESQLALSAMVLGYPVTIKEQGASTYGRVVGTVFQKRTNINKKMVKIGAAWWYKSYSKDYSFKQLQESAKKKRLGLWAADNPQTPSDYRHKKKIVIDQPIKKVVEPKTESALHKLMN